MVYTNPIVHCSCANALYPAQRI